MYKQSCSKLIRAVAQAIVDTPLSISDFATENNINYYNVVSFVRVIDRDPEPKQVTLQDFLNLALSVDLMLLPCKRVAKNAALDLETKQGRRRQYFNEITTLYEEETNPEEVFNLYINRFAQAIADHIQVEHPFENPEKEHGNRRAFAQQHNLSESYLRQVLSDSQHRDIRKIRMETFCKIALAIGWNPTVGKLRK